MATKKKINPKTGQITSDPEVAKNTGATKDYNPQPRGYQINNTQVSKEDYNRIKKTPAEFNKTLENPDTIRNLQNQQQITPQQQEILQKQNAPIKQDLQQSGALDKGVSQVDLTPVGGVEALPGSSAIVSALGESKFLKALSFKGNQAAKTGGQGLGQNAFPVMFGDTPREIALKEISAKTYDKGISNREAFGAMIEAIPGARSFSKYLTGFSTPSSKIKTIKDNIDNYNTELNELLDKSSKGLIPPEQALSRLNDIEDDIAVLEGKLKLLSNASASLRSNPEELLGIQQKINKTLTDMQATRQNLGIIQVSRASGNFQIPTDEQIYLELLNK